LSVPVFRPIRIDRPATKKSASLRLPRRAETSPPEKFESPVNGVRRAVCRSGMRHLARRFALGNLPSPFHATPPHRPRIEDAAG
jgi:hypothetical protein